MKRALALLLCGVLAVLCACEISIERTDNNSDGISATRVTEYEFFSYGFTAEGFNSATEAGLIADSGTTIIDGVVGTKRFSVGTDKKTGFYVHTLVDHKNSKTAPGIFNRGYDIYRKDGEYEFGFLHGTYELCIYKKLSSDKGTDQNFSNIALKAIADDFLYNIMPSGWKEEYSEFNFTESTAGGNYIAYYTRIIEGYKTDDVLKVEVTPGGEIYSFEAFGREKYEVLQNTVTSGMLSKAEAAFSEYAKSVIDDVTVSETRVVTDNKGQLYLRFDIGSGRLAFAKISEEKLQMTEEYKQLIESNYQNNKALDDDPKTTTKGRLINDQNGKTIAKFMYGNYSASYNSCGAIAVHNAKVLLGYHSTLSETIYDIQNTAGMSLGGAFGSNAETVPEIMKKYGIKCTLVTANTMGVNGVYIVSFWHENPPWNGTHTVAVYNNGRSNIVYNLTGDGTTSVEIFANYGDRIISVYKLG